MTAALQAEILVALEAKPDQKADELARQLECSRTDVNKLLYGPLKSKVKQDRNYKWSLAEATSDQRGTVEEAGEHFANTDLARLCRYYLACLGYDDTGVSTFLTSKYGDPDYLEVSVIPRTPNDLAESEGARSLLGRKRTERGRYGLYFGYPTNIAFLQSRRSSWQGYMVEPILLFPIEQESGTGRLAIDLSYPIINQKPFQNFTNFERDMLMNELVQLEQELGLTGEEGRPDIDEIAMRLQAIRPEWPWKKISIRAPSTKRERRLETLRMPVSTIGRWSSWPRSHLSRKALRRNCAILAKFLLKNTRRPLSAGGFQMIHQHQNMPIQMHPLSLKFCQ